MNRSHAFAILAFGVVGVGAPAATTVSFPNFSDLSTLQLNGSAATIGNPTMTADGAVLRLTNNLAQSGSAFSKTPIPLQGGNSFSSYFSFRISNPLGSSDVDGQGADGITFTVQTVANNVGGSGGGIGYQGILNSVGIEFDTWNNGSWDDNSGNHLGINIGGNIDSVVQTPISPRMNDGQRWYSWVDYNGATDLLEVRLSLSNARPITATLSYTVDLESALGGTNASAFAGFTSGTGAAGGYHDIIEWEFRDTYNPVIEPNNPTNVPDGGSTALLLLLGFGAVLFQRYRARPSN